MDFAKRYAVRTLSLVLAASVAHSTLAQAPAPPTLWSFLGFPRTGNLRAQFVNRRGNLPGLEKKPPLKNIADPANLAPDMPKAIQEAAKIKQQEDLAKQKIKAIKYLGKIGCGCYPGVKEGLLAALDDCTEEVRYEAVQAFMVAAGDRCQACSETCCDAEVIDKLNKMATEMDEKGCYVEPSARVRAAAAQAARICEQIVPAPEPIPVIPTPEGGGNSLPPPVTMMKKRSAMSMLLHPTDMFRSMMDAEPAPQRPQVIVMDREVKSQPSPVAKKSKTSQHQLASLSGPSEAPLPVPQPERSAGQRLKGTVAWVGAPGTNLRLHFPNDEAPAVGEELRVYHDYLTGRQMVGKLQVVAVASDGVWARPLGTGAEKIASGDAVVTLSQELPAEVVRQVEKKNAVAKQTELSPVSAKKLTPIKQPAKPPVTVPRAPSSPAVQVTDSQAKPLAKTAPTPRQEVSAPVVRKHLPPRSAVRPMATSEPPRLFDAPPTAAAPSQTKVTPAVKPSPSKPAPLAIPTAKPSTVRTVAQASRPVWVGDSKVEFATDQK